MLIRHQGESSELGVEKSSTVGTDPECVRAEVVTIQTARLLYLLLSAVVISAAAIESPDDA